MPLFRSDGSTGYYTMSSGLMKLGQVIVHSGLQRLFFSSSKASAVIAMISTVLQSPHIGFFQDRLGPHRVDLVILPPVKFLASVRFCRDVFLRNTPGEERIVQVRQELRTHSATFILTKPDFPPNHPTSFLHHRYNTNIFLFRSAANTMPYLTYTLPLNNHLSLHRCTCNKHS